MAAISFYILIVFLAFAAGQVNNTQSIKKEFDLLISKTTADTQPDFDIIRAYLDSCPEAMLYYRNCVRDKGTDSAYKSINSLDDLHQCQLRLVQLKCIDQSFGTSTCEGKEAAVDAERRIRSKFYKDCGGATSIYASFTLIMLSFVTALKL